MIVILLVAGELRHRALRKSGHRMKPEIELESSGPETNLPGLDFIRRAVRLRLFNFEKPASLRQDLIAGVSGALSNVPDGMANGAILGVNPIFGLYGSMIGPTVGGIFSDSQLMIVTTMAAASLSASQALGNLQGDERTQSLFAMVIMVGVFQILAGVLKLGKILSVRLLFCSHWFFNRRFCSAYSQSIFGRYGSRLAGRSVRGVSVAVRTFLSTPADRGPGSTYSFSCRDLATHAHF